MNELGNDELKVKVMWGNDEVQMKELGARVYQTAVMRSEKR